MATDGRESPTLAPMAFPEPAIVVGIGRFGLATLERLGMSWSAQQDAHVDPSIGNLRLIHACAAGRDEEPVWRGVDRNSSLWADVLGVGNSPQAALDFAILRTLGLVRYRDGVFEVAVPRDGGAVVVPVGSAGPLSGQAPEEPVVEFDDWAIESDDEGPAAAPLPEPGFERLEAGAAEEANEVKTRRIRYFRWLTLDEDPVIATDLLRRRAEREKDLDLFLTPILSRVRGGHSPSTIVGCIMRAKALAQGRDPSPWKWCKTLGESTSLDKIAVSADARSGEEVHLDRHADALPDPWPRDPSSLVLRVPLSMLRNDETYPDDLDAPIDPRAILNVPWELTGWTMQEQDAPGDVLLAFTPLDLGWVRLGLFDGSMVGSNGAAAAQGAASSEVMRKRLMLLSNQVFRGLLALFIDLRNARVQEYDVPVLEDQSVVLRELAIDQTLDVLSELLVRDLGEHANYAAPKVEPQPSPLPSAPSRTLVSLELQKEEGREAEDRLRRRLGELGLLGNETPTMTERVYGAAAFADPGDKNGFAALRDHLRHATRSLYRHEFQAKTTGGLTRRIRRLTVYVIGDLDEPFARSMFRGILSAVHAELLRDFGSLFQRFREGFDRTLCVTPIAWLSHAGQVLEHVGEVGLPEQLRNAQREAHAVLDALFQLRRTIEEMPRGDRCVSQLFANARVNERAVLSLEEAARQTHDYLWLQIRSRTASDDWLQRVAIGPNGKDFLGTFSCVRAEFPAERASEYLANRFSRACLANVLGEPTAGAVAELLKEARDRGATDFDADSVEAARSDSSQALREACEVLGASLAAAARGGSDVVAADRGIEVAARFGAEMEARVRDEVQHSWQGLTEPAGDMDRRVDELRVCATKELERAWDAAQRMHDGMVGTIERGRVATEVVSAFREVERETRDELRDADFRCRADAEACRSPIPDWRRIVPNVAAVRKAALDKPDRAPMALGWVMAVVLAPALLGPVIASVALAFDLQVHPGILEAVLGVGAPYLAIGLVGLAAWFWLRAVMRRALAAIGAEAETLASSAHDLIAGGSASVFSFLDQRIGLASATALRRGRQAMHGRTAINSALAHRIERAAVVQARSLRRKAEDMGAYAGKDGSSGIVQDDVSAIFSGVSGGGESLIEPKELIRYYRGTVGQTEDPRAWKGMFIRSAGGLSDWRETAPFSDESGVLQVGRSVFSELRDRSALRLGALSEAASLRMSSFLRRHYQALGFGAVFTGYEGSDQDGVRVIADATLVVPEEFGDSRRLSWLPTNPRVDVRTAAIPANSVFLLSMAQGIAAASAHNFQRYESYHDRTAQPGNPHYNNEKLHMMSERKALVNSVQQAFQVARTTVAAPKEGA